LFRDGGGRIVISVTPFSPFDRQLLEEGLAWFDRPRLARLLESLGASKYERVATLATMLRHCPPEEFDEALDIFERAATRAARDRAARDRDSDEERTARPERRASRSAERRAQRRRS
jgi:hypothetical protein